MTAPTGNTGQLAWTGVNPAPLVIAGLLALLIGLVLVLRRRPSRGDQQPALRGPSTPE